MKLKSDEPLSNFAFNYNLRRYIQGGLNEDLVDLLVELEKYERYGGGKTKVGRCRLTVSKPELKARLVSVLENKM